MSEIEWRRGINIIYESYESEGLDAESFVFHAIFRVRTLYRWIRPRLDDTSESMN